MHPEEAEARRALFADMPSDSAEAVDWLLRRVDALDSVTSTLADRLAESTDPTEREELDREIALGLWMRGAAKERAWELMIDRDPSVASRSEAVDGLRSAKAEQAIGRQRVWGDSSQN